MIGPAIKQLRHQESPAATQDSGSSDLALEARDIVQNSVHFCMKNAVFGITRAHPDIAYLEFKVAVDAGHHSRVVIEAIDGHNRIMMHGNVRIIEDMVNQFAASQFHEDELQEFFDGRVAMASGIIKEPSHRKMRP